MYLLDTNVISELRKAKTKKCDKNVENWASNMLAHNLFLSVVTILELEIGVLSIEKRDTAQGSILRSWLNTHVLPTFNKRILPVDLAVAQCCAQLHVPDRHPERDAIIAATAMVHGLILVTRNVGDFKSIDIEILNPWES